MRKVNAGTALIPYTKKISVHYQALHKKDHYMSCSLQGLLVGGVNAGSLKCMIFQIFKEVTF